MEKEIKHEKIYICKKCHKEREYSVDCNNCGEDKWIEAIKQTVERILLV